MHWTFFIGKFKILASKRNHNNNNSNLPNISTIPINIGNLRNNFINPLSYFTNKKNDLLIKGKYKSTNLAKFDNILVENKNINIIRKENGNNNNKLVKKGYENKNYLLLECAQTKPIYLTRSNGNTIAASRKPNNKKKEIFNKMINNAININEKNGNMKKYSSEGKEKKENNNNENYNN